MRLSSLILLVGLILFVTACKLTHSVRSRAQTADEIANTGGFQEKLISTSRFSIQSWHRFNKQDIRHMEIYIEGDGLAWRRKKRLSDDPTPVNPLAFRLAQQSSAAAVVYLARPCQYTMTRDKERCIPGYWSSHRYSEDVVDAMNEAIDIYKEQTGVESISLIGYSGGGVIAALLAARRTDVKSLVSVAANLDHQFWTGQHKVTPLTGSLNPTDFADDLLSIPQLHFVGADDSIVGEEVVRSYINKVKLSLAKTLRVIDDVDHDCCWVELWPTLQRELNALNTR